MRRIKATNPIDPKTISCSTCLQFHLVPLGAQNDTLFILLTVVTLSKQIDNHYFSKHLHIQKRSNLIWPRTYLALGSFQPFKTQCFVIELQRSFRTSTHLCIGVHLLESCWTEAYQSVWMCMCVYLKRHFILWKFCRESLKLVLVQAAAVVALIGGDGHVEYFGRQHKDHLWR